MYQLQSNEKTSTKRVNSSGSYRPGPQKKKTSDITRSTPWLILPKTPLTEQQQQNVLQQQQKKVIQSSQPQQQWKIHPQLQQQEDFSQVLPHVHQQYEYNTQLYGLPPTLKEVYEETALLVSL